VNTKFLGKCSAASVTATVTLHSDTSLVRIIMVDALGKRRLLLEAYPLICSDSVVHFTAYYDETKYMPYNTNPDILEFYLVNAECNFSSMVFSNKIVLNYIYLAQQSKQTIESQKANQINDNLELKGLPWRARVTKMNTTDYSKKAQYWGGDKYFIDGYDYYAGGIFCEYSRWDEIINENIGEKTTIDTLPPVKAKSFDWRKAHGANLNTSPYFDGNPDYGTINIENTAYLVNENNGWLTSVKDMHTWGSCPNGCYLFAPIGSLEAVINLYFNQHLDYNISEQHLADCFNVYSPTSDCINGGKTDSLDNFINTQNYLFVDESNFGWNDSMTGYCCDISTATFKIDINEMITIGDSENEVKRALVIYGPLSAKPKSNHIATLVGYKQIQAFDTLNINYGWRVEVDTINHLFIPDTLVIYPGNKLIGRTMWIFKESASLDRGVMGYFNVLGKLNSMPTSNDAFAFETPIADLMNETLEPLYFDGDGDGYYNWGIGEKPAGCPGPDLRDCNDNNPNQHHYNAYLQCVCACDSLEAWKSDVPIYITSNTILKDTIITRPIIVQGSNVMLTLQGDIQCTENVYIQSEIGTTIEVENANIFNGCDTLWQGFRITANLDPTLGITGRSLVMIKQSYIEDAKYGICSDAGAIIRANNSCFKYNFCDVLIVPLQMSDYYDQVLGNNTSVFENCHFSTDNEQHYEELAPNVILVNTKGVQFKNCRFIDDGVDNGLFNEDNRMGIWTYKSGFRVDEACYFGNLGSAIRAYNGSYLPIDIEDNLFETCHYGVYLSQSHGARVVNNIMRFVDCDSTDAEVLPYCVYLDNSYDFQLEGNTLYVFQAGASDVINGVIVNDVFSNEEKIYRNDIKHMRVSIEAIGLNRSSSDPGGLLIRCNNFDCNRDDIFVTNNLENPYPSGYPVGIAGNQGSMMNPAGNQFSKKQTGGGGELPHELKSAPEYRNILNTTDHNINYFYHDTTSNNKFYPDSVVGYVNRVPTGVYFTDSTCLDNTDTTGNDTIIILPELRMLSGGIDEIDNTLEALTDGGNTPLTIAEIVLASDLNAWQTYLGLMDKSPYLSNEALKEVALKEDALTKPMVRDVLVANPQASKDPEIQKILDERIEALPQYMIDQINSGLTQISPKEYLEMQRAELSAELSEKTSRQLRYYLRHPELYNDGDVEELLSISQEPQYGMKLAAYYGGKGDYGKAIEALNAIESNNGILMTEAENLAGLYELLEEIESDSVALNRLGVERINALLDIEASGGQAGAYARGLLMLNGASDYKEPVYLPDVMANRKLKTNHRLPEKEFMKVYPNPADKYITVEYSIATEGINVVLKVVNTESKTFFAKKLESPEDIILIDIRNFSQGNYIVFIEVQGKIVDSKVVSVTK